MHFPDRYALALEMLEGDRTARKILADLLEEQGERGLAQWARQGGNNKRRLLDFAVMLLPCREAVALANGFIGHAFADRQFVRLLGQVPGRIAEWCRRGVGDEEIVQQGREALRTLPIRWNSRRGFSESYPQHLRSAVENLVEAIECAIRAERIAAGEKQMGTPNHWRLTALQHLRAVATASQNQARPARKPATATAPSVEADWQIQQAKALFAQFLAQDEPWPK